LTKRKIDGIKIKEEAAKVYVIKKERR